MFKRPTRNHNVYILGAGFSQEAGFPLINDFIDQMGACQTWLQNDSSRMGEVDAIEQVFKFQQTANSVCAKINLNPNNIEDLFSLASASLDKTLKANLVKAISSTIDYASIHDKATGTILDVPSAGQTIRPCYTHYVQLMLGFFLTNEKNKHLLCDENTNTIITFSITIPC
ncbi:MAG TPA: hypothetical protein VGO50_21360 [Pyrinomonadaceae bacterium]|jgi:hypothetical protein|nr:hypothetical protein [Pyrinomonadaceae bacterium]